MRCDGCKLYRRQSTPRPIRGRVRARHKIAFAQGHGEHAGFILVKLNRGAGGETSRIPLTAGEVLLFSFGKYRVAGFGFNLRCGPH